MRVAVLALLVAAALAGEAPQHHGHRRHGRHTPHFFEPAHKQHRQRQRVLANFNRRPSTPWNRNMRSLQQGLADVEERPDMTNSAVPTAEEIGPPGARADGHRVAAVMFGQLRTLQFAAPYLRRHILEPYDADVVACIVPEHAVQGLGDETLFNAGRQASDEEIAQYFDMVDQHLGNHVVQKVMIEIPPTVASARQGNPTAPAKVSARELFRTRPVQIPEAHLSDFRFPNAWGMNDEAMGWTESPQDLAHGRGRANATFDYTQYVETRMAEYQCWMALEDYQRRNQTVYDYVVRVRFDTAFFDVTPDLSRFDDTALYIPEGYNFGGFNDRHAMGPTHIMEVYSHKLLFMATLESDKRYIHLPPEEAMWRRRGIYMVLGSLKAKRWPCVVWQAVESAVLCQLHFFRPPVLRWKARYCTVRFKPDEPEPVPVCDGDTNAPGKDLPYGPLKRKPISQRLPYHTDVWFNQQLIAAGKANRVVVPGEDAPPPPPP